MQEKTSNKSNQKKTTSNKTSKLDEAILFAKSIQTSKIVFSEKEKTKMVATLVQTVAR